jgi:hypothetical protein
MIAAALFSPTIVKTAVNIRGKKKKKTNFSLLPFWTSVTDWTSPFLDGWMNRINWLSFSPLLNFYFTPLVRDGNPIDKGCVCVCVCVLSRPRSSLSRSVKKCLMKYKHTFVLRPPHFPYWNEARTERAHVQEEELEMIQNNVRNRQNQLLFS